MNVFVEAARNMLHHRSRASLILEAREATERPPGGAVRPEELEAAGMLAQTVLRMHEEDLESRRKWAARIREEFSQYHDHSGGGECGACGAIQAANWLDPDYTQDGPTTGSFLEWKERRT